MDLGPVNDSEAFVLQICQRSFLSLWCYNNPLDKPGKELCDILVVCDPHIIIISVKDCKLSETKDLSVAHDRWRKKAIEKSLGSISRAERRLASKTHVTRKDGSRGIELPDVSARRIHRIAVAFGSRGEVPIHEEEVRGGHVHVMDDSSFRDILTELDTITDFVGYLVAKEQKKCAIVVTESNESGMLAWYLEHDRTFPKDVDFLHLDGALWEKFQKSEHYQRKSEADKISYAWDDFIETMSHPEFVIEDDKSVSIIQAEAAVRVMAKESRFSRRVLGDKLVGFLELFIANKITRRFLTSISGVTYVFAGFQADVPMEHRLNALQKMCLIARHVIGHGDTVIGLGFVPTEGRFYAVLAYFYQPDWTPELSRRAAELQKRTGIFTVTPQKFECYEYPPEDMSSAASGVSNP